MKGLSIPTRLRFLAARSLSRVSLMSQRRFNSTEQHSSATGQKPAVSPHVGFYKTFTRPVTKVLLMATLTYQLAYWAWVKLEKDEIKAQRQAEIAALESQLQDLTKSKSR